MKTATSLAPKSSVDESVIQENKTQCSADGVYKNQRYFAYPEDLVSQESRSAVCLRRNIFSNILPLLEMHIQNYGAVMYYAHQDGIIYNEFGDPELLDYFRDFNLTVGASIKDQYIGTTAASFVKPGTDCYIAGEDHYVDVFREFTTYCVQHTGYVRSMYIFIVMPLHKLNNSFIAYMRMCYAAMQSALNSYLLALDHKLHQDCDSSLFDQSAVLSIDLFGTIINANKQFYNWFNTEPTQVKGLNCLLVLPELKRVYHDLVTGKTITHDSCHFISAPHSMQELHLETKTTFRGIKWLGSLIIISNKKTTRKIPEIKQQYSFNDIVGNSPLMRQLKRNAINAAQTDSYVVLTGESGTGKEYFAQAIHKESARKNGPFVSINCSSMPEELISSELFGYVEGAFTGGKRGGAMGKFEFAHKGTIFLDEIGDMPANVQAVLLRVLEEKSIYRLGSNSPIPVDVRIICATNKNLKEMVKNGTFRLDLYYRINVININLPPLRNRKEDLPLLLDCHMDKYNMHNNKIIKGFTDAAIQRLLQYDWPGNIRELRNMVEYGSHNATDYIDVADLPNDILESAPVDHTETINFASGERDKLVSLMFKFNGNKSKVAKEMGMSRGTLYKKLEEHSILRPMH